MRNALSTVSKLNNENPFQLKMTQHSKAFTLVEIFIVVVIIGLIAAMAIPAFEKVKENSLERRIKDHKATPGTRMTTNSMIE
jgi:prepilin-type N-terminal cleavage/methylation domain-containing protein